MNINRYRFIVKLIFCCLLVATNIDWSYSMPKEVINQDVEKQVKIAFDAARKGNFELSSKLSKYGEIVIPYLEQYLSDSDMSIRGEVVSLLKEIGGEKTLGLMSKALGDTEQDVQVRAANALYENYSRKVVFSNSIIGKALIKSVESGNDCVSALLLLSYFPGVETEKVLRTLSNNNDAERLTKLFDWSPAVNVSLPANVALARLDDLKSRNNLLEMIESAKLEELEFLLEVIEEIDSPQILQLLKITLDDTREISSGVPSSATPKRRLCDLAVNSFVHRLTLKVNFNLSDSQKYSNKQISKARDLIDNSIPK